MPGKGRPKILVRLHPEALRQLQARADRAHPGRKSGLSAYVRELLYAHLGFDSGEWEATSKEADSPS